MVEDLVRLVTSLGCFGVAFGCLIGSIVSPDAPPAARILAVLFAGAFFLLGIGCLRKPAGNRRSVESVHTAHRMGGHAMWLNAIINLSLGFFGFVVGVAAWLSAFPGPRSDYRWLWWVGGIIGLIIGKAMADALTTASSSTGTRPQARPAAPVNAVRVSLPPESVGQTQPVYGDQPAAGFGQCPNCREWVSNSAVVCHHCQASLRVTVEPKLTICPDCGRQVSRRAVTCPGCGAPLVPGAEATAERTEPK